jgi:ABC-type microcin C transport system permease subunit YejE
MTLYDATFLAVFADCELGRFGSRVRVETPMCIVIWGIFGILFLAVIVTGVISVWFPNLMNVDLLKSWRRRR